MEPFTVYMLDDKGNVWKEDNYDGYGVFGGKDFYELLSEMNDGPSDRQHGIDLYFYSENFKSPNLVEDVTNWKYKLEPPKDCPHQGWVDRNGQPFRDYDYEKDCWND